MTPTDLDGAPLRLAFVSAPGTSIFIEELLDVVADAVRRCSPGVEVVTHRGLVTEVADRRTIAVVVPHEYFAIAPHEDPALHRRMIAFGVEHPGTATFTRSSRRAAELGGWFEISAVSVAHLERSGHRPRPFPLGHSPRWDTWGGAPVPRPVDVAYLGTADPRRLQILAANARELSALRCELLIPPHEPMTGLRPDFLPAARKWELLARSKLVVNLHRGTKRAFEWVRALEAICNGCVVLTEPSDDLGPLVPGEHVLVADPNDLGRVAREAVSRPDKLQEMAVGAYDVVRAQMDMAGPAAELVEVARSLCAAPFCAPTTTSLRTAGPAGPADATPLARWVPAVPTQLSVPAPDLTPPLELPRPESGGSGLAVLCVQLPRHGPWRLTQRALPPQAELYVARRGAPAGVESEPAPNRLLGLAEGVGEGAARNLLLREITEDHVAVLAAGDEVLGDALSAMAEMLTDDPSLDAVLCPATYDNGPLVNVLVPELRRLESRPYLDRGYVVRRSVLESLGGFTEDPAWDGLVDHHFWLSFVRAGGRCGLLRRIGLALWPRVPAAQAS